MHRPSSATSCRSAQVERDQAWLQELEMNLSQPDVELLAGLMIQVSSTDAN